MTSNRGRRNGRKAISLEVFGGPLVAALIAGMALALTPAYAQSPGSSLATSYAANANKPIDIEADTLEVDDKKKIAVFSGNVIATQGDFNLRAREIEVTYAESAKPAGAKTAEGPSAGGGLVPGGAGAEITRIDAKGKVLVTTKDSQTATSDWAVFEVKKQLVTIGGDVVLTQGTNTIKGSRLVIDLTTGLSRFETGPAEAQGEQPKERLRAIFTPKNRSEVAN